ncbi:hypothetical protein LCGC14_1376650 [marine sediment metagenome]|uniref:Lipoprotein n=1 Tax=marine sediment metagenome TaxID=412755 RepID=A0A0F9MJ90_9ZZZZ
MKKIIPMILSVCLLSGCVGIQESRRIVDRPIQNYETREDTSDWKYETKVAAYSKKDGTFPVAIRLFRYKDCTITTHKIFDRTEYITRTGLNTFFWYLLGAGTALGGGTLSVGARTLESMQEHQNGYLLAGGGAFVAALGLLSYAIINDVRALDSIKHVGQVNEDNPQEGKCWRQSVSGVHVELKAPSGRQLLKKMTDTSGFIMAKLEADEIFSLGPDYRIMIKGREIGQTKAFSDIFNRLFRKREKEWRQTELSEQMQEREDRRQAIAKQRELEETKELMFRVEANQIRRAQDAVKVWSTSLRYKLDRTNSKIFLFLHFENLTYRNVIGVTTRVRIFNPFGKMVLSRVFEDEIMLPRRKGIAESVRVENESGLVFEELSRKPDYRQLLKVAVNGKANIQTEVLTVVFENGSVLKTPQRSYPRSSRKHKKRQAGNWSLNRRASRSE